MKTILILFFSVAVVRADNSTEITGSDVTNPDDGATPTPTPQINSTAPHTIAENQTFSDEHTPDNTTLSPHNQTAGNSDANPVITAPATEISGSGDTPVTEANENVAPNITDNTGKDSDQASDSVPDTTPPSSVSEEANNVLPNTTLSPETNDPPKVVTNAASPAPVEQVTSGHVPDVVTNSSNTDEPDPTLSDDDIKTIPKINITDIKNGTITDLSTVTISDEALPEPVVTQNTIYERSLVIQPGVGGKEMESDIVTLELTPPRYVVDWMDQYHHKFTQFIHHSLKNESAQSRSTRDVVDSEESVDCVRYVAPTPLRTEERLLLSIVARSNNFEYVEGTLLLGVVKEREQELSTLIESNITSMYIGLPSAEYLQGGTFVDNYITAILTVVCLVIVCVTLIITTYVILKHKRSSKTWELDSQHLPTNFCRSNWGMDLNSDDQCKSGEPGLGIVRKPPRAPTGNHQHDYWVTLKDDQQPEERAEDTCL